MRCGLAREGCDLTSKWSWRALVLIKKPLSSELRLVNPVRAALAFACFVAGTVAFLRFFFLIPTLRKERIGQPPSKMQLLVPWLPGQFTRTGARLRRQMNGLMLLGWAFLIAGLFLSPR